MFFWLSGSLFGGLCALCSCGAAEQLYASIISDQGMQKLEIHELFMREYRRVDSVSVDCRVSEKAELRPKVTSGRR